MGTCANAPMVQVCTPSLFSIHPPTDQINDDYYECLTPQTVIELIEACKNGTPPPVGKWGSLPMNGQVSCEGPLGKTSLLGEAPGPGALMRPDSDLAPKVNPADVKKTMGY
jgi:NADH dehydrogenase (ubiquinone) flavoprotein 2